MNIFIYKYLLGGVCILSLVACVTAAEHATQHNPAHSKTSTSISGKVSAPIEMKYTLDAKPELGKPLNIEIQFSTSQSSDQIKASIKPTTGLNLQTMQHDFILPLDKKGETTLIVIPLTPQEAGLNYLHIIARINIRGKSQAKAFSIPVTIGTATQPQKASNQKQ
ncbi:MAG: hypothetical protein GXP14_03010 [Gammaproteobacteria bacterium]|nr:hypothetical protein [Gammaproteobacteria bacterium]